MSLMRAGILAHSIPAAVSVFKKLEAVDGLDVYVLLCVPPGESEYKFFLKNIYRFLVRPGRLDSIRLAAGRRVRTIPTPLDGTLAVEKLRKLHLDVGLHLTGTIYRETTINAFRLGILNPHIGILPQYRGRSVLEWALIEGGPVGISVFFVDTGIDTGERIVVSEKVDVSQWKSIDDAKTYMFGLAPVFFGKAVKALQKDEQAFVRNDGSGRRYYVVSDLFKRLAEARLRENET